MSNVGITSQLLHAAPNPERSRIPRWEKSPLPQRPAPELEPRRDFEEQPDVPAQITGAAVQRPGEGDVRVSPGPTQARAEQQNTSSEPSVSSSLKRSILLCSVLYDDWTDFAPPQYVAARTRKTEMLQELVDVATRSVVPVQALEDLVAMVLLNVERSLPTRIKPFDPDEDEPLLTPGWIHRHLCYDLLGSLLELREFTPRTVTMIGPREAILFCHLMDSEALKDRDYVKTIIHRIYSKYVPLRAILRKEMGDIFTTCVHDFGHHNGLSEMLEILGSIINGFVVPLKVEHVDFLLQRLVPLYRLPAMRHYCAALTYCISEYLSKSPELAPKIIGKYIRYVPKTNSSATLIYIQELDEIANAIQASQFADVVGPICSVLARLIRSDHFQVAERALAVFHNRTIINMVSKFETIALPIVFPALTDNTKFHWHHGIAALSANMLSAFREINPPLFGHCTQQYTTSSPRMQAAQRRERWSLLDRLGQAQAAALTSSIDDSEERRTRSAAATQLNPNEAMVPSMHHKPLQSSEHNQRTTTVIAPPTSAVEKDIQSDSAIARKYTMPALTETGQTPCVRRHIEHDVHLQLRNLQITKQ